MEGFSQALDAFVSLALKLFGVWYVGIADKVVDTPVGEELVNNLRRCHLVVRTAPSLHKAGNHSIIGVYNERIELNFKPPVDANRRPWHMSFALEHTRRFVLEHSVENEVVFADFHGCALQVGCFACGELLISELHPALAVVVITTDKVGECKGGYIYRVVFEYSGCIVRGVWHHANHTI